ncbi:putative ribonuclease H-like domain-containing protein, partial [Tanacetum coccineum]
TIDKTLFIKRDKKDIMLVQVYVDDIIFESTKKSWCDEFEALMKSIFQMSSMGELTFFLGLQVKQNKVGIFISQDKYVAEILKKFDLVNVKTTITPMKTKVALTKDEEPVDVDVTSKTSHLNAVKRIFKYLKGKPHLGLWYPRESPFDLEAFSDTEILKKFDLVNVKTAITPMEIKVALTKDKKDLDVDVTPKTSHLNAMKRIFKYLKGKPNLGLWYPRDSSFNLEAYSNSDYTGAKDK